MNNNIFETGDFYNAIKWQYSSSDAQKFSLGWKQSDEVVQIVKGQLSIITGVPSSGKSNWLDAVMVNLANKYDWRFGVFSPESQPLSDHVENLIIKKYQMPLRGNWVGIPNIPEKDHALAANWCAKHFHIMDSATVERSIENLLNTFRHLASQQILDAIVLDPWNEIVHARESFMSETEYLGVILGKIKAMALELNLHIFIVAHPTKLFIDNKKGNTDTTPKAGPYDISGSANWYNKADNIFSVYRDLINEDFKTVVLVQKVKRRRLGKIGSIEFEYIPSTAGYR